MTKALPIAHPGDPGIGATAAPEVPLQALDQLWFQVSGTVCNLRCSHCFISCSPENHSFWFMSREEVATALDESVRHGVKEYYFTGGEPFMNPGIIPIMEECLGRGFQLLVLTNAMRPMMKYEKALLELQMLQFKDAAGTHDRKAADIKTEMIDLLLSSKCEA